MGRVILKKLLVLQFAVGLSIGLFSVRAWPQVPTPSPSPLPEIVLNPETGPDPVVRMRAPKSYLAKKIGLFPLEFPSYVMRGITWPVHELTKLIERTKFAEKAYHYFLHSDVVFYPIFQIGGGDGIGGGFGMIARDMFDSQYDLGLSYAVYGDLDQRASLKLSSPDYLIGDMPWRYNFRVRFRDKTDTKFYGIGSDTSRNDKSEFGFNRVRTGFQFEFDLLPSLTLGVPVEFMTVRTNPEDDQSQPSVEQVFPLSELVAFRQRTTYAIFGIDLIHDTRDKKHGPSGGGVRQFRFQRYQGINGDQFSFNEFEVDIRQFFRIWSPRHVIMLRNAWVFQDSTNSGGIPFELLTTLDLDSPLRGFNTGRFRDSASVLFNFEYRYPIWDYIDGLLFVDTGKVFGGIKDFNFDDWRYSVGAGIRMYYEDHILMRIQAGYGGEGPVILLRIGEAI